MHVLISPEHVYGLFSFGCCDCEFLVGARIISFSIGSLELGDWYICSVITQTPGPRFYIMTVFRGKRRPTINIPQPWDSSIFMMANPTTVRNNIYIETAQDYQVNSLLKSMRWQSKGWQVDRYQIRTNKYHSCAYLLGCNVQRLPLLLRCILYCIWMSTGAIRRILHVYIDDLL